MTVALTVSVDDATLGALDRLAKTTDRPRDWLVAQAIEDYVALNAWAVSKIEAGLAAAEAGDFASPEEVARVRAKFAAPE
jgi:predicted transcriptional regulator